MGLQGTMPVGFFCRAARGVHEAGVHFHPQSSLVLLALGQGAQAAEP